MRNRWFVIIVLGCFLTLRCNQTTKKEPLPPEFWHNEERLYAFPFSLWEEIIADSVFISKNASLPYKRDSLIRRLNQLERHLQSKAPTKQNEIKHKIDEARKGIGKGMVMLKSPLVEIPALKKVFVASWYNLALYHQELIPIFLKRKKYTETLDAWEESLNYLEHAHEWKGVNWSSDSQKMYEASLKKLHEIKERGRPLTSSDEMDSVVEDLNELIRSLSP